MEPYEASSSKNPAVWNPVFYRDVSSCGWNKWDFPNHTRSLHDPLTAHRVNALSTEQFSALWCLHLVTGLREQQENNRGEIYARARAWKGEAKGEGSLTMPFSHLSCPNCHLLSFHPTHSPVSCITVVMVPISFIRTLRSEKVNSPVE